MPFSGDGAQIESPVSQECLSQSPVYPSLLCHVFSYPYAVLLSVLFLSVTFFIKWGFPAVTHSSLCFWELQFAECLRLSLKIRRDLLQSWQGRTCVLLSLSNLWCSVNVLCLIFHMLTLHQSIKEKISLLIFTPRALYVPNVAKRST